MFMVPCRCCPMPAPPKPKCIPCDCGKQANPQKSGESLNARRLRLLPITDSLEADRRMTVRKQIENRTEIRKTRDIAKFRTETQMEERNMDLERKSDRLKLVLDDDMFDCTQQILNAFEQQKSSRIESMRQRVAALKEKREKEDAKLVQQKLEQRFVESSEEYRTLKVTRMAKEIAKDWGEQIKMKQRLECEEEENDRLYAYLWLKDAENKLKREKAHDCMRAEAIRKEAVEVSRQLENKRLEKQFQAKFQELEISSPNAAVHKANLII